MKKRIKSAVSDGRATAPELSRDEALELLRRPSHAEGQGYVVVDNRRVPESGLKPDWEVLQTVLAAFPTCTSLGVDGERRVHWRRLAHALISEFVPAAKPVGRVGRPREFDGQDFVDRLDQLLRAGEAGSVKHACAILAAREGDASKAEAYLKRRKQALREGAVSRAKVRRKPRK